VEAAVTPHGALVRQGQERARARGVRLGPPTNPALTADVLQRARAMRAAGMHLREIASELHVPKSTLHRALRRDDAADVIPGEHGDE
jgi:DNA invertase Pin-like site-specific DNA recombinase